MIRRIFAATVRCVQVTAPMLDEIIAFLNEKNREYAEGDADYNWSVWVDNCVHTLRNTLAAAQYLVAIFGAGREVFASS